MKFVAVATKNGMSSGLKDTRDEVERWARQTFESTKTTEVYILQAVSVFTVAPREIIETQIDIVQNLPKSNGHDPLPQYYEPAAPHYNSL